MLILKQPEVTLFYEYFRKLTCFLFSMDSSALLMINELQIYLFGQIQTSQTGGQLYSYTLPYGEWSLVKVINFHLCVAAGVGMSWDIGEQATLLWLDRLESWSKFYKTFLNRTNGVECSIKVVVDMYLPTWWRYLQGIPSGCNCCGANLMW